MDDFRVGYVPPPDVYGQRQSPEPKPKKNRRARSNEAAAAEHQPESFTDTIEDYYLPSDPSGES